MVDPCCRLDFWPTTQVGRVVSWLGTILVRLDGVEALRPYMVIDAETQVVEWQVGVWLLELVLDDN